MSSTILPRTLRSTKYRLLGLVGRGQFGQVYCAIHRKTGRLVALKNLNRDRFATHQFLRELRFLLSLDHPHIANCLALDQSGNGRQLVLDYCEGGTLRDLLEQGTSLTLAEILTFITEVLTALEHAQLKNLIHCDIKPENILLTLSANGWHTKVSDFGIARLSQDLQADRIGATGSPAYMAPERFYFQHSVASDLYAVGVVLYELLTGDRPFSGNYNQLMVCHLNQAITIPNHLPSGMQEILKKSMEKLAARRFRSAADMKAAIVSARRNLSAGELRDRYPKTRLMPTSGQFAPQLSWSLSAPCHSLKCIQTAEDSQTGQLLAACGSTVYRWPCSTQAGIDLNHPQQWQFDSPVQQTLATADSQLIVTPRTLHQLMPDATSSALAEFESNVRILAGSQRWLVAQSVSEPRQFWLCDRLGQVPSVPRALPCLLDVETVHTVALDERYLVLAAVDELETQLYIVTRWGKQVGKLLVRSPFQQVFPSQEPRHFLAQAGTHGCDLLVIGLQPYRVMRIRLDITVDWIGELSTGFVVISSTGQLRLINFQGQLIGKVDGLPVPTAMCTQPPFHIWLASDQKHQPRLHYVDIRELNLDIIF